MCIVQTAFFLLNTHDILLRGITMYQPEQPQLHLTKSDIEQFTFLYKAYDAINKGYLNEIPSISPADAIHQNAFEGILQLIKEKSSNAVPIFTVNHHKLDLSQPENANFTKLLCQSLFATRIIKGTLEESEKKFLKSLSFEDRLGIAVFVGAVQRSLKGQAEISNGFYTLNQYSTGVEIAITIAELEMPYALIGLAAIKAANWYLDGGEVEKNAVSTGINPAQFKLLFATDLDKFHETKQFETDKLMKMQLLPLDNNCKAFLLDTILENEKSVIEKWIIKETFLDTYKKVEHEAAQIGMTIATIENLTENQSNSTKLNANQNNLFDEKKYKQFINCTHQVLSIVAKEYKNIVANKEAVDCLINSANHFSKMLNTELTCHDILNVVKNNEEWENTLYIFLQQKAKIMPASLKEYYFNNFQLLKNHYKSHLTTLEENQLSLTNVLKVINKKINNVISNVRKYSDSSYESTIIMGANILATLAPPPIKPVLLAIAALCEIKSSINAKKLNKANSKLSQYKTRSDILSQYHAILNDQINHLKDNLIRLNNDIKIQNECIPPEKYIEHLNANKDECVNVIKDCNDNISKLNKSDQYKKYAKIYKIVQKYENGEHVTKDEMKIAELYILLQKQERGDTLTQKEKDKLAKLSVKDRENYALYRAALTPYQNTIDNVELTIQQLEKQITIEKSTMPYKQAIYEFRKAHEEFWMPNGMTDEQKEIWFAKQQAIQDAYMQYIETQAPFNNMCSGVIKGLSSICQSAIALNIVSPRYLYLLQAAGLGLEIGTNIKTFFESTLPNFRICLAENNNDIWKTISQFGVSFFTTCTAVAALNVVAAAFGIAVMIKNAIMPPEDPVIEAIKKVYDSLSKQMQEQTKFISAKLDDLKDSILSIKKDLKLDVSILEKQVDKLNSKILEINSNIHKNYEQQIFQHDNNEIMNYVSMTHQACTKLPQILIKYDNMQINTILNTSHLRLELFNNIHTICEQITHTKSMPYLNAKAGENIIHKEFYIASLPEFFIGFLAQQLDPVIYTKNTMANYFVLRKAFSIINCFFYNLYHFCANSVIPTDIMQALIFAHKCLTNETEIMSSFVKDISSKTKWIDKIIDDISIQLKSVMQLCSQEPMNAKILPNFQTIKEKDQYIVDLKLSLIEKKENTETIELIKAKNCIESCFNTHNITAQNGTLFISAYICVIREALKDTENFKIKSDLIEGSVLVFPTSECNGLIPLFFPKEVVQQFLYMPPISQLKTLDGENEPLVIHYEFIQSRLTRDYQLRLVYQRANIHGELKSHRIVLAHIDKVVVHKFLSENDVLEVNRALLTLMYGSQVNNIAIPTNKTKFDINDGWLKIAENQELTLTPFMGFYALWHHFPTISFTLNHTKFNKQINDDLHNWYTAGIKSNKLDAFTKDGFVMYEQNAPTELDINLCQVSQQQFTNSLQVIFKKYAILLANLRLISDISMDDAIRYSEKYLGIPDLRILHHLQQKPAELYSVTNAILKNLGIGGNSTKLLSVLNETPSDFKKVLLDVILPQLNGWNEWLNTISAPANVLSVNNHDHSQLLIVPPYVSNALHFSKNTLEFLSSDYTKFEFDSIHHAKCYEQVTDSWYAHTKVTYPIVKFEAKWSGKEVLVENKDYILLKTSQDSVINDILTILNYSIHDAIALVKSQYHKDSKFRSDIKSIILENINQYHLANNITDIFDAECLEYIEKCFIEDKLMKTKLFANNIYKKFNDIRKSILDVLVEHKKINLSLYMCINNILQLVSSTSNANNMASMSIALYTNKVGTLRAARIFKPNETGLVDFKKEQLKNDDTIINKFSLFKSIKPKYVKCHLQNKSYNPDLDYNLSDCHFMPIPSLNNAQKAVKNDDVALLKHCLNYGIDPNDYTNHARSWTLLFSAAAVGSVKCVTELLSLREKYQININYVDSHKDAQSIISYVTSSNNHKSEDDKRKLNHVRDLLVKSNCDWRYVPNSKDYFILAPEGQEIYQWHPKAEKIREFILNNNLQELKNNFNQMTIEHIIYHKYYSEFDRFNACYNALHFAVMNNKIDAVVCLLDMGANVNAKALKFDNTNCIVWTQIGEIAASIFSLGAYPGIRKGVAGHACGSFDLEWFHTPLYLAIKYGFNAIRDILLSRGANLNILTNKDTNALSLLKLSDPLTQRLMIIPKLDAKPIMDPSNPDVLLKLNNINTIEECLNKLTQEKNELTQQKNKLTQEKDKLTLEKKILSLEKDYISLARVILPRIPKSKIASNGNTIAHYALLLFEELSEFIKILNKQYHLLAHKNNNGQTPIEYAKLMIETQCTDLNLRHAILQNINSLAQELPELQQHQGFISTPSMQLK